MSSVPGKFILTQPESWQFRRAQLIDPDFATKVRSVCEMNKEIRSCYLMDTRKKEGSELKLTIAVSLNDEATEMDRIAIAFQEMLREFPIIAEKTVIMSARSFEKGYVGAEFYVRSGALKRLVRSIFK